MGTTLTGTTPQDTYDSLIKVTDNGPLSGTAKYLSDGLGNDSVLALSTSAVGIGTATPSSPLDVIANSSTAIHLRLRGRASDNVGQMEFWNNAQTTRYAYIAADSTSVGMATTQAIPLTFATNTTERLRIDSTGNVGIGTTAPAAKLDVSGAFSSVLTSIISVTDTAHIYRGTPDGIGYEHAKVLSGIEQPTSTYGSFLAFYTEAKNSGTTDTSTEKVRITSNGYMRMAASTGGIQFNGDTAAANALDDYEEGTWTMGVAFGGASVGVTTSQNTGTYTKIGRQVTVNGYLLLTSKGSSTGAARITGLPFTVPNNAANYATAALYLDAVTFTNQFQGICVINNTTISLEEVTVLGISSALTNADFANTSGIIVGLTYFV